MKQYIQSFEGFINEKIDMSNAKIGQIHSYGEKVLTRTYGLKNGILELGTLKFPEAQSIAKELKAAKFDAEAHQVKGAYYDGYVHVKAPRTHDDIVKMASVIEDTIGHILVDDNKKRVRETGKL